MQIDRSAIKALAKQNIKDHMPQCFWLTYVFFLVSALFPQLVKEITFSPIYERFLLTQNIQYLFSMLKSPLLFLLIVLTIFQVVLDVGYVNWSLKLWRRQAPSPAAILEGFSHVLRILLIQIFIFIIAFVCIFFPVFIVSFFIALSNPFVSYDAVFGVMLLLFLLIGAIFLFVQAPFAFVNYIIWDHPELSAFGVIKYSLRLTSKRITQVVVFQLSFFGWELLLVLVSFLCSWIFGMIFSSTPMAAYVITVLINFLPGALLALYTHQSHAGFYEKLVTQTTEPPQNNPDF